MNKSSAFFTAAFAGFTGKAAVANTRQDIARVMEKRELKNCELITMSPMKVPSALRAYNKEIAYWHPMPSLDDRLLPKYKRKNVARYDKP